VRRGAKCSRLSPEMLGFIFCGIFSNLGPTGCRRGRTPERPLRQPSKIWLIKPDLSFCGSWVWPRRTHGTRRLAGDGVPKVTNWYRRVLRSEEGCLYGGKRLVSVSLSNARERNAMGEGLRRHPMCLLRSRVRSPSSAGRALCRERPGRSGGGGTSGSLSRQERESPGGEALTAVCLSRRVSAGPMTARLRRFHGVLGEGFDSYVDIHHHQARRRRERSACSVLRDWAGGRSTSRGRNDDRVGPRRQVRERRQLEDQHRQRLLRWPAVRCGDLERVRRENVCQPGPPGN
jgi:hypothetical protein